MAKIKEFVTKNDVPLGVALLLLIVLTGYFRGYKYSTAINNNSKITYASLFKESSKHYTYFYVVEGVKFEGKINSSRVVNLSIGDKILVQYAVEEPMKHIIYSIDKEVLQTEITLLPLKKVKVWDAF